jgi:NAD-dependent SIR2 family protein deacetylase
MTTGRRITVVVHEDGTETKCPKCGKTLDAATGIGDYSPRPGDVTVCNGCESALQYTESLHLRPLPDQVWAEMDLHEKADLRHAQEIVRKMKHHLN